MLYSRKVWVSILALCGVLLAHYSGLPIEVQGSILAVGVALIGSIAWEDAAAKSAPKTISAGAVETLNVTPAEPDKAP